MQSPIQIICIFKLKKNSKTRQKREKDRACKKHGGTPYNPRCWEGEAKGF